MAYVEARMRVKGKQYEISVDVDEALKLKKGAGNVHAALNSDAIYHDIHKGTKVSNDQLMEAFGTTDVYTIATKIIKDGEVQKPQEFRDAEREARIRQVIDLLLRNAVDQHGKPYTEERLRRAIDEVHFNFDKRAPEAQMHDLIHKLKEIIPIKVETKRIKIIIPAQYTGHIYGLLKDYKESEDWQGNGDLVAIIAIPAGMQIDFFEKLNAATHGAVQSEELDAH